MSTIELVDPELRDALALWPTVPLTSESLAQRRAAALATLEAIPKPHLPDITADEIRIESAFGARPIRVLAYRPAKADGPLPAMVHIHGGGFVMGAPEMKDVENRLFASELRCAVYSVDHRLAPEAPHPAPVEDIYSVFVWLHANAGRLGLDRARIGIKGESGGGGFAAAAALYARDQQGPNFAFQHLIYPMIDDRQATPSSRWDLLAIWPREMSAFAWQCYLGDLYGTDDVPAYAAAARAHDLARLAPAYVYVGGLDGFLHEDVDYAARLLAAGVSTELHVLPLVPHGFDQVAPDAAVTATANALSHAALARVLN
jgi:acetyl esterase/lipase